MISACDRYDSVKKNKPLSCNAGRTKARRCLWECSRAWKSGLVVAEVAKHTINIGKLHHVIAVLADRGLSYRPSACRIHCDAQYMPGTILPKTTNACPISSKG